MFVELQVGLLICVLVGLKQIECLEENAESLRERTIKFHKGCRKYLYVSVFTFLFLLSLLPLLFFFVKLP